MCGVNGRLAVVARQARAGMPPLARLAGKGCAQRRGGRRRERGVAPGQNGRLLRLQLDGFGSAVIGGSGSSFSQATTKVRRHRRLIFLPSADSTSTRQGGAQGLRASQGTCASTPAQPPARMVSVRPVLDGGCSSSTTSSTLHLDDVINLRRGHRCACTSEVCSKSALRAPSDVNGMREVMTRRCA